MSGLRNDQTDDLVTQAVAATRQLPLPTGPSTTIASQTLAALREAASRPKATFLQSIRHMPWTSKTIAVLATAASLLIVYVGLSTFTGSALAFAEVVKVLNEVRSATWKTTTEVNGLNGHGTVKLLTGEITSTPKIASEAKGPPNKTTRSEVKLPDSTTVKMSGVGMFLAPSHERIETTSQGAKSIEIIDGKKNKMVALVPTTKTAMVFELKNLPPDKDGPFGKTFQGLQQLVVEAHRGEAENIEPLGSQTFDGRPAEGFRIVRGTVEVKFWADAKTLLPVRVEQSTTSGPKVLIVMTDFQINVDLDESLFSLEVPKDYTIQQTTQLDLAKNPITYLAETLKMVAEQNNGAFPPTLRGEEGIDGILERAAKRDAEKGGKDMAEVLKRVSDLATKLGGTFGFLYSLSPENDWHYAGKDVKLNTPNRSIFWYRRNKASTTYYVLYADLSVKEVPSEQIPKAPPLEESPKP